MKAVPRVRVATVLSSQDGGYYAEVWDVGTGREVLSTEVHLTACEALAEARRWCAMQGYEIT